VCVEEVDAYKRELAHKVQVFFEAKVDAIERQIAKTVAAREAVAEAKLKSIAAILEGIEVDDAAANTELQAARTQIEQLRESLEKAKKEQRLLEAKAKRAIAIAESAVVRSKALSEELAKVRAEQQQPKPTKKGKKAPIAESKAAVPAKPKTTRMTSEEQLAKPAKKKEAQTAVPSGFDPAAIAAQMDD